MNDLLTGRKQAEITSNWLAAIVESSDDGIISKDMAGIITSWNAGAETIFGYTADEMIGTSIMRLIPAEHQEEERYILKQISQGAKVSNFETVQQAKDGRLINVSVTASPIKDSTGRVVGVSKIVRDITERKRAETERERLIGELKAALAEIKTLSGLLPICAGCKKIRDDKNFWHSVESYLESHSEAKFTHGLCPNCIKQYG